MRKQSTQRASKGKPADSKKKAGDTTSEKPRASKKRKMGPSYAAHGHGSKEALPVTLLSGFLGAGKSTLLKHILTSKEHGLKVCVIVNDMAELNIDASYARSLIQRQEELVQMQNGCICCTLRQDLLEEVSRLAASHEFDYLVIESTGISEPMQVAETFAFPLPAALQPEPNDAHDGAGKNHKKHKPHVEHDNDPGACPRPLMSMARLDTCVTVVDCATFHDNLNSVEELKDSHLDVVSSLFRHGDEVEEGDDRNIASLLVDQVEFADVILLNKADLVKKKQLKQVRQLVSQLNPSAEVLVTKHCEVPLARLLNTRKFSLEKAAESAGWLKAMNDGSAKAGKSESEEYGVTSFVYRARRPFHPGRLYNDVLSKYFLTRVHLYETLDIPGQGTDACEEGSEDGAETHGEEEGSEDGAETSGEEEEEEEEEEDGDTVGDYANARNKALSVRMQDLGGLMRSKGYMWVATANNTLLGWSHAGALLSITQEGRWFACKDQSEWPEDPDICAKIRADFDPDENVGDRRQELVFIGQHLKEDAIRAALDACLATDSEICQAAAGKLQDPLLGDEDEDTGDKE